MFNWIIGIPLLALFAVVGLAIVIVPSTRGEPSRPTLTSLLLLIALCVFSSVMVHSIQFPSTTLWIYLILLSGAFIGAVGVHFSVRFAHYSGWRSTWVVRIYYLVPVLLSWFLLRGQILEKATLLRDGYIDIQWGSAAPILWGIIGSGILFAIGFLLSILLRSSQTNKKRVIFPLLGYMIMCLGAFSNLFVSPYPIDIAANFIFVSMLAYGVVDGHLLKPSIKKPLLLTLSMIFGLLTLCYAAMFTFVWVWIGYTLVSANIIAGLVTLIFGIVMFGPTRKYLLNILERLLFPSTYRYEQALAKLARSDISFIRGKSNIHDALKIIAEAIRASGVALLLRKERKGNFEAVYAIGENIVNLLQIKLPINSLIVTYLDTKDVTLTGEEIEKYFNTRVVVRGEDDTLREIGSTLFSVIRSSKGPLAILVVTRSLHRGWYEDEAIDFLKLVCNQIATNIINEELYQASKRETLERKRVEEKSREADNLRELERLRTELLANISHELRTPLASIKGYSTMLLEYDKRLSYDEKRGYLGTIDKNTDRLTELIDQLMDMSRLSAGILAINKAPADINKICHEAIVEAQVRSPTHRILLDPPGRLPRVNIDAKRIRQVLDNLIGNATNYSETGTEVVLAVSRFGYELLFSVSDQGIGISKKDLPRVFERLFRSKQSLGMRKLGIGLGLSICKGLIEAHGGKIWIESEEAKGTTCFFTLPIYNENDDSHDQKA